MKILNTLFRWYGKKTVYGAAIAIIALIIIGLVIKSATAPTEEDQATAPPTVNVATINTLTGGVNTTLIGSVEARNEAVIETESAGRVTAVRVELGDTVTAGQILVQLENASEAASVLQAEGAYEAALATAAQSDLGVPQAQNAVTSAEISLADAKSDVVDLYRDAYNVSNEIVLQQIDDLYENAIRLTPRLTIDPRTYGNYFETERIAFRSILSEWQAQTLTAANVTDPEVLLQDAESSILRINVMLDRFIELLPRQDATPTLSETDLSVALSTFIGAQSTLNGLLTNISEQRTALANAETSLQSAKEALAQAEIGGTNQEVSAANAQVKQALGSLRSAQAALAKTIVRSPIAGQVNKIDVNPGDFLGSFSEVAIVANNNALEITTFVSESDLEVLSLEQEVILEGGTTGIVTNIAPAVDPVTKKIEVKIATEAELFSGDTITITLPAADPNIVTDARIFVPITAVKFTAQDGTIFTVVDNALVANPVVVGQIRGSAVEILEGVDSTTEIVVDARGLSAGAVVETVSTE